MDKIKRLWLKIKYLKFKIALEDAIYTITLNRFTGRLIGWHKNYQPPKHFNCKCTMRDLSEWR